ncbi:DUF3137 domain-containing protein [Thermus sp.]|uniref:DUF3137 domain-containing protein n=1 Tax=Thermus sp. TaxID=275 RepID=UPI00307D1191
MKGAAVGELESYRRRVLLWAFLLGLLGAGSVGWAFAVQVGEWPFYLGAILLLGAWGLPSLYVDAVKGRFLPLLAGRMGFRYRPEGLPWEAVAPSGLFRKPDRYRSEDRVEGEVGGIPFLSTDLALWEKRRGCRGRTYYALVFKGTLYRLHLPFPAATPVRIAPQGMGVRAGGASPRSLVLFFGLWYGVWLLFGYAVWSSGEWDAEPVPALVLMGLAPALFLLSRLGRGGGLARVRLEGPEFERLFDAFGADQVAARKLLTPAVMEALVEARGHLGRPFWVAVEGESLWVALPGDHFRISPFRPLEGELARAGERWEEELSEAVLLVEAFRLEEERIRRGLLGER